MRTSPLPPRVVEALAYFESDEFFVSVAAASELRLFMQIATNCGPYIALMAAARQQAYGPELVEVCTEMIMRPAADEYAKKCDGVVAVLLWALFTQWCTTDRLMSAMRVAKRDRQFFWARIIARRILAFMEER